MKRFHVTYEIVTPESAEHGDAEERGYMTATCGGDPLEIVESADDYAMSLREAIGLIGCVQDGGDGSTYYETDGRQNYRTGAETRYAFHLPDNATASSLARVARLLKKERLL